MFSKHCHANLVLHIYFPSNIGYGHFPYSISVDLDILFLLVCVLYGMILFRWFFLFLFFFSLLLSLCSLIIFFLCSSIHMRMCSAHTRQNSNFDTLAWTEHVLHVCRSCGRIGGGTGLEKGEIKRSGRDKLLVWHGSCPLWWILKCSIIKVLHHHFLTCSIHIHFKI